MDLELVRMGALRVRFLGAWLEKREPVVTVVGAACAFVTAFATTWIAIQ